eukprot:4710411-Alexandrium_andersonii.AAC.2
MAEGMEGAGTAAPDRSSSPPTPPDSTLESKETAAARTGAEDDDDRSLTASAPCATPSMQAGT